MENLFVCIIHQQLSIISIRRLLGAGGNEYGQCGEEPERKDDTGRPLRRDITIPQRCATNLSVRQVIFLLNYQHPMAASCFLVLQVDGCCSSKMFLCCRRVYENIFGLFSVVSDKGRQPFGQFFIGSEAYSTFDLQTRWMFCNISTIGCTYQKIEQRVFLGRWVLIPVAVV